MLALGVLKCKIHASMEVSSNCRSGEAGGRGSGRMMDELQHAKYPKPDFQHALPRPFSIHVDYSKQIVDVFKH